MKTTQRYLYLDQDRISATVLQQAAAEARWLAGATPRPSETALAADRERRIRDSAYQRAQRRGFVPGFEVEDWLAAEEEVDGQMRDMD